MSESGGFKWQISENAKLLDDMSSLGSMPPSDFGQK
jgi:hypothetical protein